MNKGYLLTYLNALPESHILWQPKPCGSHTTKHNSRRAVTELVTTTAKISRVAFISFIIDIALLVHIALKVKTNILKTIKS